LRAVFLSYASQDAEAARHICEALRAAGIEVWFDKSELRGGDVWDRHIRKQILDCALFLPIISSNTQARPEGYFRLEWKLAVERTHLMSDRKAFLVPVVIDDVRNEDADVPEAFRIVQWTRLPAGETPVDFVERVHGLKDGDRDRISRAPAPSVASPEAVADDRRAQPRASAELKAGHARRFTVLKVAVPAVLLVAAGLVFIPPWQKREHARNQLLPDLQSTAATMIRSNLKVFDEAVEAEKYLPNDPILAKLWPMIATTASIETEPAGAMVSGLFTGRAWENGAIRPWSR
jgi:hypothetical protein